MNKAESIIYTENVSIRTNSNDYSVHKTGSNRWNVTYLAL